jgi:indolepyruvate ferredoxin oxidoreductase
MARCARQWRTLTFNMAPPLLARRDASGNLVKREYGSWMFGAFGVLARPRGLRGTVFDIFGYTEERRGERALIDRYQATIEGLLGRLDHHNLGVAVEIASLPDKIRGFGHVRAQAQRAAMPLWDQLLKDFDRTPTLRKAA